MSSAAERALPPSLVELLRRPSPCFIATVMPDGSPQLTETWVDTDGTHILINTVEGFQKLRNIARDPRVALNIADPDNVSSYVAVRGHVVATTTDGGADHIEALAQRYLGRSYPWYGGRHQTRVIVRIAADHVSSMGG